MGTRFAQDTAVSARGDGRYDARIDPGWWIERGPNGGYVAASILRAVTAEVADPERRLRSFTVHYLAPPAEGAVEVVVTVERQGRSMTSASARLAEGGRLLAIAVAAFSTSRPSIEFCDLVMPEVVAPEQLEPMPLGPIADRAAPADGARLPGTGPLMRERYEQRWAVGPQPFSGADGPATSGGWIRLARQELGDEGSAVDEHLLVAMADAWIPPIFGRITQPVAVPTIDLTVHLRNPLPPGFDDWILVVFRSSVASDGFVEEDGELWSRDGLLLAQSCQLAVVLA